MKLLRVDASAKAHASITRELGDRLQARLVDTDDTVIVHDVGRTPLPHVDEPFVSGLRGGGHGAAAETAVRRSDRYLDDLEASDALLIGTPMYNFTVPSALKSWIDHIVRAGRTFRYTEKGPEGLLADRPVTVLVTSGGIYSEGPGAARDHLVPYLRTVLGFIGLDRVEVVRAEGLDMGPEARETGIARARRTIDEIRPLTHASVPAS